MTTTFKSNAAVKTPSQFQTGKPSKFLALFKTLLITTLLFTATLTIRPHQANAAFLDFAVVNVAPTPSGARVITVDLLDLGQWGCSWHQLFLNIDGVPYPINGYNLIGTNGVIARAWFFVPSYFGTHSLQLQAVYPVRSPSPYYPGFVFWPQSFWSLAKFYTF